jgi:CubicO group peptidase (beta-lactamase class C family)
MLRYFLPGLALTAAVLVLPAPQAQAQAPQFTSFTQFNDTLVARFNRGDFKAVEAYGSPALKKLEAAGTLTAFLARQQPKTGRILSASVLAERGNQHEFAWRGEKQNLRVRWVSSAPGVLDDYFISDFIAQPTPRATPLLSDNRRKTALDQAVDQAATLYMQSPEAVGMSIGVYWQGQTTFYNYGEVEKGSGRLPTSTTFYDMGSVAKTFVTTLLAQAVLDKKVQLTDDIRKYLPGQYPNLEYQGQPVRLVDLATHTSGIPGRARTYSKGYQQKLDKEHQDLRVKLTYYNKFTADSLLQAMHEFQLASQPGTVYRYNNLGILVLQLVLERAYQQPYEQLVTRYVQSRFGMKDTKRVLSPREQQRFATGYDENQRAQKRLNYTGYWGGTMLSSTPADLMAYLRANLSEREPAVKLAHQPAWNNRIGLGWMLDTDAEGQRRIFHNGHSPGFNTRLVMYPGQDVGFVILVNENISQTRVTDMEELLKRELPQAAPPKGNPGKPVGSR